MTSSAVLVEDVHVRFGGVHALAGVDLDVPAGTTLGVLGHNGAGKTTLIRVLTTLIKPGSGRPVGDRPAGRGDQRDQAQAQHADAADPGRERRTHALHPVAGHSAGLHGAQSRCWGGLWGSNP